MKADDVIAITGGDKVMLHKIKTSAKENDKANVKVNPKVKKYLMPLILIIIPFLIWTVCKQIYSPWWLENLASTPFIIVIIYTTLAVIFIHMVSLRQAIAYFLINFDMKLLKDYIIMLT